MSALIQIVCAASGIASDADGKYLREFTPATMRADGSYGYDGSLVLCESKENARRFRDFAEAFEFYSQSNGTRPDGKPNRPLTSYTVEIVSDLGDAP